MIICKKKRNDEGIKETGNSDKLFVTLYGHADLWRMGNVLGLEIKPDIFAYMPT